ncbi:MAG: geranylgeranylglycerol-phosphate geranylgeranyltransferase [Sphingobacteriales bacterium]|nr:geranylgeranylglycerol-phosphate geranylgeranyltransferase [Sphingobacteriales bacterium]
MFKLIRPLNLFYVALIMLLLRYCIVTPLFGFTDYQLSLSTWQYLLLILSTVLITAGGYIINDYYDVAADTFNKPMKLIIGTHVSPEQALKAYMVCNALGIGLALYLATVAGSYKLVFVQLLAAILLWFYSTKLQKMPLIGNLTIAFLGALMVLLPAFYEAALADQLLATVLSLFGFGKETIEALGITLSEFSASVLAYFYSYAFFAFLFTLVRELVKDAEDAEGDENAGYKTLPIVAGLQITKLLAVVVLLIAINYLVKFMIVEFAYQQYISTIGIGVLIVLPCIYMVYSLWKARMSNDFHQLSTLIKGVMFVGLLYMPYLWSTMQSAGVTYTNPNGEITNIQFTPNTDSTTTPTNDTTAIETDTTQQQHEISIEPGN